MALVAPSIVRYTIVGTLFGEDCMSILDFSITDEGLTVSRNEAIALGAGDLLNQWSDHVLPLLSSAYTAIEVRWVDLDTANGGTGSVSSTDGSTWPEEGGSTGAVLPNSVYCLMVKQLEGKTRTQRNGALRLGGILETHTTTNDANLLTTEFQTAVNGAFESLKDGMNGADAGYTGNLVVVHTKDDVYTGESEIASFSARPIVGTLRRRMPGYGQ